MPTEDSITSSSATSTVHAGQVETPLPDSSNADRHVPPSLSLRDVLEDTPREPPPRSRSGPLYDLIGPIPLGLDIVIVLIEHSEFLLLASWRQTCRMSYRAVGVHLRHRYEKCLRPFVSDIARFDSLLLRHGAIVSGSVALHYFLPRAAWSPNDLDIYVPEAEFESFVTSITSPRGLNFSVFPQRRPWETLRSSEPAESELGDDGSQDRQDVVCAHSSPPDDGFADVGDIPEPSSHSGIREVRQFYTCDDRRVDVISVPSHNPVAALKHYWTSLVMNFLRPNLAVSGFPLTTLDGVGILKPCMTSKDEKAVDKYGERGFDLVAEPHLAADEHWESPFFGTRKALVVPFRQSMREPFPASPVVRTDRGWALSSSWPPPVARV